MNYSVMAMIKLEILKLRQRKLRYRATRNLGRELADAFQIYLFRRTRLRKQLQCWTFNPVE